jgi:hypothetical protein
MSKVKTGAAGFGTFMMGFVICPCPFHGAVLGSALLGAAGVTKFFHDRRKKKCAAAAAETACP